MFTQIKSMIKSQLGERKMNVRRKYKLNGEAETDDPITLSKIWTARNYVEMRALKRGSINFFLYE